jgi:Kdo2-lipid IVA lauroyltransferase/acyltransferase
LSTVSQKEGIDAEVSFRERVEFAVVWVAVHLMRLLPRRLARAVGAGIAAVAFRAFGRLRGVGVRNLKLAFPEMPEGEQERILRSEYRNLGTLLAEFCLMPEYTAESASRFIRYEGLEDYVAARERGKGVLVLTGHLGAWELSSFYHSLMGMPMGMVIRRLDNPLVDEFVNRIRCLHGNRVIHKDDFARGLIASMRAGQTVGILMDTNMTPPQGVFVPFFGVEACTASGVARIAAKTGAAVVPGFLLWEESEQKYVLRFSEELEVVHTRDSETDVVTNTAAFTAAIERTIRQYPDQWLWMHRRWKTRPPGEEGIY